MKTFWTVLAVVGLLVGATALAGCYPRHPYGPGPHRHGPSCPY